MRLATKHEAHLTYGTNTHPGDSLDALYRNIGTFVLGVKHRVCPDKPFGVGLRLSARAADELSNPRALAEFRDFLQSRGLYVFTINGFAYGAPGQGSDAGGPARPDWLEVRRLSYADRLAVILAALLPSGVEGTVSTAPGAEKRRAATPAKLEKIAQRLMEHAMTLDRVHEVTGKSVCLCVEPQALYCLDGARSAASFLEERVLSKPALSRFAAATGKSLRRAEEALRRHLGVCLDSCQLSMGEEDPVDALSALDEAGVRVPKFRLTSALELDWRGGRPAQMEELERFAEGAVFQLALPDEEGRIQLSVPVSRRSLCGIASSQPVVARLLELAAGRPGTKHFELEAHAWRLLPPEQLRQGVIEAVAQELSWVVERVS